MEQCKDSNLQTLIGYLTLVELPVDSKEAQCTAAQSLHFGAVDDILYFVDPKAGNRKCMVVPAHLHESIFEGES